MILEKLLAGNEKAIEIIRILCLMLLVAVAVYQLTAQDICSDFSNTTLDNKDKFGFFYECRYLNQTELDILQTKQITTIYTNLTPNFINN